MTEGEAIHVLREWPPGTLVEITLAGGGVLAGALRRCDERQAVVERQSEEWPKPVPAQMGVDGELVAVDLADVRDVVLVIRGDGPE